jgi:sterol desaturase/sphingolipid hydroxylase (fatty acid hydroxylase superfamily)
MQTPIPEAIRYSDAAPRENPRDTVRHFKTDLLERFTHVHPVMPLVIWVPVTLGLAWRALAVQGLGFGAFAAAFLAGAFVWTFVEYALHRFAFHFPAKGPIGRRFVYVVHGLHHEDPQDPTRLVMPPLPGLIYGALFYLSFRAALGATFVDAFFAGFLVGYLAYDYIHFYVHHFVPANPVGKFLKRYHMLHHYSNYEAKWGVSNPLWDHVFGTVEARRPGSSGRVQASGA